MSTTEANIKLIRLITGDDIISEIVYSDNNKVYTLKNPLRLLYMIIPNSSHLSISFGELIYDKISDTKEIMIKETNILFEVYPTEDMKNYYLKYLNHVNQLNSESESEDISNESMSYVKNMLDDIRLKKGKLH